MTLSEGIELAFIPIAGAAVLLAAGELPDEIGAGRLLLIGSALLLLQSLVRDVWLLVRNRRTAQSSPPRRARCMCIESTVGAAGVLVGALLLGVGIDRSLAMNGWGWSALVIGVLGTGFAIKDYVFEWNPFRIRRDKDHMNIVVTWKT